MADSPKTVIQIRQFPGLVTNADPRDMPPGTAQVQINLCSFTQGVLGVRAGYRPVTFEND